MTVFCIIAISRCFLLARVVLVLSVITCSCLAQGGTAELSGTVTDPSGLVVAQAHLQLTEESTHSEFRANADEHGDYHFLGLPVGQYALTVEKVEFKTYNRSAISLR